MISNYGRPRSDPVVLGGPMGSKRTWRRGEFDEIGCAISDNLETQNQNSSGYIQTIAEAGLSGSRRIREVGTLVR